MKKKIAMLLVMAMTLPMAACGSQESGGTENQSGGDGTETSYEGETLVVQVWGGTYEETMRNDVIPKFEEETGATVEVFTESYTEKIW